MVSGTNKHSFSTEHLPDLQYKVDQQQFLLFPTLARTWPLSVLQGAPATPSMLDIVSFLGSSLGIPIMKYLDDLPRRRSASLKSFAFRTLLKNLTPVSFDLIGSLMCLFLLNSF